jgi:hypothetical protein
MAAMSAGFGITTIKRDELPPGKVLCEYCTAKCCRYFALPIETPEEYKDFEYIRWYLLHDRATVFKDDDDWYLLVHTTCKHLQPNNMCGIYHTRPDRQLRVRQRLDLRFLSGDGRASVGIHRGGRAAEGPKHPQPQTRTDADTLRMHHGDTSTQRRNHE